MRAGHRSQSHQLLKVFIFNVLKEDAKNIRQNADFVVTNGSQLVQFNL